MSLLEQSSNYPAHFGPYRRLGEIGRGAMGAVFEVEHGQTGMRYALKVILPDALDRETLGRFTREAEALAQLDHPHVARIHAAHLDPPLHYLVLDMCRGGTLKQRMAGGPMPIAESVLIAAKLAHGLAHAHERRILHRDVKPGNVLFSDRDEPILCDFGLARGNNAESLTRTGDILGTPLYMAPEQVIDGKRAGPEADVYGLGAMLYRMLTGVPPIQAASTVMATLQQVVTEVPRPARELRPEIPVELDVILRRTLAKEPTDRLSAHDLAAALRELQAEERPVSGPSRRGLLAGALVTAAVLSSAFAVWAVVASPPAESTSSSTPEDDAPAKPRPALVPSWLEQLDRVFLSVNQHVNGDHLNRLVWSELEKQPDGTLVWAWTPRRCSVWTGGTLFGFPSMTDARASTKLGALARPLFARVGFRIDHRGQATLLEPVDAPRALPDAYKELAASLSGTRQERLVNRLLALRRRTYSQLVPERAVVRANGELVGAQCESSNGWASIVPSEAGVVQSARADTSHPQYDSAIAKAKDVQKEITLKLPNGKQIRIHEGLLQGCNGIARPELITGTVRLPDPETTLAVEPRFDLVRVRDHEERALAFDHPWGAVVGRLGDFRYLQLSDPGGDWQSIGWYGGAAWVRNDEVRDDIATERSSWEVAMVCAERGDPLNVRQAQTGPMTLKGNARFGSLTHGSVVALLSRDQNGPGLTGDWGAARSVKEGTWVEIPWGPERAFLRGSIPTGRKYTPGGRLIVEAWRIYLFTATAGHEVARGPDNAWLFGKCPEAPVVPSKNAPTPR